ncbi:MAG: class II aldolase/adducin family protein [Proteobacteria bacterium]|nr:class II aldolase/adducin family protein [Pseudomonadota bacterium]
MNKLKNDIVKVCKMMHSKGFICATDGNVSVKLSKNAYLITRSGINKGFMCEDDIILINDEGKVIEGGKDYNVSTEWRMHLKAYEIREDINAVIHAHPPYITAYTIAGLEIPSTILPEIVLTMGNIPVTRYSIPTSPENAQLIEQYIAKYNAIVLSHHGTLTVGKDVFSAYNKLEQLEYTATAGIAATILGGCNSLPSNEIEKLFKMGKEMGLLSKECDCAKLEK